MPRLFVVLLGILLAACGRSAEDRRLDALFAHQAALRDTTGTITGTVLDSATRRPLAWIHVSSGFMGDMTDRDGRFTIQYVPSGVAPVIARSIGYLTAADSVLVTAPDTVQLVLRVAPAAAPCCRLTGRWQATFELDSAGFERHPTARVVEGFVSYSPRVGTYLGHDSVTDDGRVRSESGLTEIDFSPFWGAPIGRQTSTTIFGSTADPFLREAIGQIYAGDSVSMSFIPRISHGGVSLDGRIAGDTIVGRWHERSYAGGAFGRVRLVRISKDPGELRMPAIPKRTPPDTLAEAERGAIRVRVWDEGRGDYIRTRRGHALRLPDGALRSVYSLGTTEEGWGPSFWLPPGKYAIVFDEFPCGATQYRLKKAIKKGFQVEAGSTVDITIKVNVLELQPSRTYDNTEGRRCTREQLGWTRAGADP